MFDLRGLVPGLILIGVAAGVVGTLALYGVVTLIGAHVSITWR